MRLAVAARLSPRRRARSSGGPEPDAPLLGRLRRDLTLSYAAALAGTLLIVGVAFYYALQFLLVRAEVSQLQAQAAFLIHPWATGQQAQLGAFADNCQQRFAPPAVGPPGPGVPGVDPRSVTLLGCYNAAGQILGSSTIPPNFPQDLNTEIAAFVGPNLVQSTLHTRVGWDIIDGGPGVGQLIRVAMTVPGSGASNQLGVLQLGVRLPQALRLLGLIRNLMLAVGGVALVLTAGGGWFLAGRALRPTRDAMARQRAFISDASHELRAPLALLRANADVLLRERDQFQPEHAVMLHDIVLETEHMAQITADLLTMARLEAGELPLEHERVDLALLAARLAQRIATLASEKGVKLEQAAGSSAVILGDPRYVEQAGLVLLENAVKYTSSGGTVTISTSAGQDTASLVVADTGVGIPADQIRRLGERFYRGDRSRNRGAGGSGLGLAIAFRIAHAHGGRIHIESEPGQWTRATLMLPAAQAASGRM